MDDAGHQTNKIIIVFQVQRNPGEFSSPALPQASEVKLMPGTSGAMNTQRRLTNGSKNHNLGIFGFTVLTACFCNIWVFSIYIFCTAILHMAWHSLLECLLSSLSNSSQLHDSPASPSHSKEEGALASMLPPSGPSTQSLSNINQRKWMPASQYPLRSEKVNLGSSWVAKG